MRDVHQQARTDDLTGLPNRRALYEHLDALANPAALLLLDLDGFKEVNDSVGHAAGDQVLVQTADRIKVVLTPQQVLARLGGDEFAILLPGATLAEAADLAWRIHVAVTCPSHLGDTQIRLGVSIGVSDTHLADGASGELLRTADIAMYCGQASRWWRRRLRATRRTAGGAGRRLGARARGSPAHGAEGPLTAFRLYGMGGLSRRSNCQVRALRRLPKVSKSFSRSSAIDP